MRPSEDLCRDCGGRGGISYCNACGLIYRGLWTYFALKSERAARRGHHEIAQRSKDIADRLLRKEDVYDERFKEGPHAAEEA